MHPTVKLEADYKTKIDAHTIFVTAYQTNNNKPVYWFSTTTQGDNKTAFISSELPAYIKFITACVEDFESNIAREIIEKEQDAKTSA